VSELWRKSHPLVDTHCHLDDSSLAARIDKLLNDARNAGVCKFVIPGVTPEGWPRISSMADLNGSVYPAYGLHPMFADRWSDEIKKKLIRHLSKSVAVGEIGLDYSCKLPRNIQIEAFRQQLRIAVGEGLPVLVHCREAFKDILSILEEEGVNKVGGIMHAFSGSPEIALQCIQMGFYISVAGPVTYKNAVRPVRVAEKIPISHLVLETDSPDLAPEPYRGMSNEPSFLPLIAEAVACIKGMPLLEVAEITASNATKILRLS